MNLKRLQEELARRLKQDFSVVKKSKTLEEAFEKALEDPLEVEEPDDEIIDLEKEIEKDLGLRSIYEDWI